MAFMMAWICTTTSRSRPGSGRRINAMPAGTKRLRTDAFAAAYGVRERQRHLLRCLITTLAQDHARRCQERDGFELVREYLEYQNSGLPPSASGPWAVSSEPTFRRHCEARL
jgi:hypothetical protein